MRRYTTRTPKGHVVTVRLLDESTDPRDEHQYNHICFADQLVSGWTPFGERGRKTEAEGLAEADRVIEAFRKELARQSQGVLLEVPA